jgi:hypothetical protein
MATTAKPFQVKPSTRRINVEDLVAAAVEYLSPTPEGHQPNRAEASVVAAHEFLAAVFTQCTPKTPITALPKPRFHAVRSPRASI